MNAISVTEIGSRRTIAEGRHLSPHEAVHPSFTGQDLAALAGNLPRAETGPQPRIDLITIPGGYVHVGRGRDGVVVTGEGRLVAETAWFADYDHSTFETLRATARAIDEDRVAIVDIGWHNYFHTLVLAMPRVQLALDHLPDAVAVLPARRAPSAEESGQPAVLDQLVALGAFGDGVRLIEDGLYRVRKLHLVWPNHPQQAYLLLVEQAYSVFPALARHVAPVVNRSLPRRIFILRVNDSRILDPQAAKILDRHLDRHGFEKVRLETLGVADQIRLFAQATHVVAAHGAGLSNIVFAKPGLRILELNLDLDGTGLLRPWFMILASRKGHHYQYLNASACELAALPIGLAFDRLMQLRGQGIRFRLARLRAWLKNAASWLRGRAASR